MDYKKAYLVLFNAATDALAFLADGRVPLACDTLAAAQARAEMLIISQPSPEDEVRETDELPEKSAPPQ